MRILIVAQEPPLDPGQVASGNALRTQQLRDGLEADGHVCEQVWRQAHKAKRHDAGFRNADELRGLLSRSRPDAILLCYWELLAFLPFEPGIPIILDHLAPRGLELLFEAPETLRSALQRLRLALGRCNLILVGTPEQEQLLSYSLLEAGFDLRQGSPVRIVPIAGPRVRGERPDPGVHGYTLLGGGMSWPWREAEQGWRTLEKLQQEYPEDLKLVRFDGGAAPDAKTPGTSPDAQGLASYSDYSAALSMAHIGLEFGPDNIERRHSHSFRAADYLRHGLPIICSQGLPLAKRIENEGAGWVIDDASELNDLIRQILIDPQIWVRKQQGACRLAESWLEPARAIAPLLDWLRTPENIPKLPGYRHKDDVPPIIARPDWKERIARRYRLARRICLHRFLAGNTPATDAVVMVTREDLFPSDHGAAVKIVETARGISRNGREVLIVTHDRRHYWQVSQGEIQQRRLPVWTRLLARPLAWVKLDHYTRDIPESNAFLYLPLTDSSFFWRTLAVASRHGARWFQAEFPAYAAPCLQAAEVVAGKVMMVEHNVEYERLRQQVPELTQEQFERLQAIELTLANRCDAVVCVSDNDRQILASHGVHPGLLSTIPHGIDLAAFDTGDPVDVRARFDIAPESPLLVYHGTFAYPPNRDALQMLADEILPRLEALGVEAHAIAVGHQPPRQSPHPRIHCTGSVNDVAPWLRAADVAVVPLREGGGTRMKIIDDFAARLPVISTAKGIEGIPACDGEEALIRDDWDSFSMAIKDVLADPDLADKLADSGRALADTLDWKSIGVRYIRLMDSLAD